MKKAFTLVELMVAVGILAIILSFSGIVFHASIDTYRVAAASSEIMRKFRAITDQLDTNFEGLLTDAPLMIFFRQDPNDPNQRYDQIMSFAYGDFSSLQSYDGIPLVPSLTGMPIRGNYARVYFGQAWSLDPTTDSMQLPFDMDEEFRVLGRRMHILNYPGAALWPDPFDVIGTFDDVGGALMAYNNERFEHDSLSLAQWKILYPRAYDYDALGGPILETCFDVNVPRFDIDDSATYHKLLCQGVGSFAIQWSYRDARDGIFRWFPSADNRDARGTYSHFDLVKRDGFPSTPRLGRPYTDFDVFGVVFNIPNAGRMNYWGTAPMMCYSGSRLSGNQRFPSGFFPDAFKFTFTLFDSKGIIEKGRTFTHIVYLD